jgi:uncharacterized protein YerC
MPTDKHDLATLLAEVEQAWQDSLLGLETTAMEDRLRLVRALKSLMDYVRHSKDAGMAPALVSREAVEALRRLYDGHGRMSAGLADAEHRAVLRLLARDLGSLLKE